MTAKFLDVLGSKIHYIEEGSGKPILLLHGVPTNSHIWRNIIPLLSDKARCIAPDLIGMGLSAKPKIKYTFFDHLEFIEEFINGLNLTDVTLVLHGLGSAIGLDYARRNESKIKAVALYEPHLGHALKKENTSLLLQEWLLPITENREAAYKAVVETSFMFDNFLPAFTFRPIEPSVFNEYKKTFNTPSDRELLWQYIQDFSVGANKSKVAERINAYSKWLTETTIPKLMLYSVPGLITTIDSVAWCKDNLPNLVTADLEEGLHFEQETNPQLFGQILRDWYLSLSEKVA